MLELLKKHPKATQKVRDWFMNKMIESLKDSNVPENFKEYMRSQGVPDDNIATILGDNPRALFDVFDNNGIYIIITRDFNTGLFYYSFDGKAKSDSYSSRKEAESVAVERAFQILDDTLNTDDNDRQDSATSGE